MDRAPAPPRSPRTSVLHDRRLVALLAELCRLQLHGRVLTETIAGEDDIRLQVWQEPGTITVELLWCRPEEPPPVGLKAVRVHGQQRQVWCNSSAHCTPAEMVRFVSDLLLCDQAALRRRYPCLG